MTIRGKRWFFVGMLLLPIAVITFTCCSSRPTTEAMPGHRDSDFVLSKSEIAVLEAKSVKGDAEAAWKLFTHYELGLRDEVKAEPWLQKAAKLGSPKAKRYIEIRSE